jgi:rhodanese-related sulfurtransferase
MPAELSPTQLKALWDQGQRPCVLDVREDWELAIARLDPVIHIPMDQIPDRLAELPRAGPIVVLCRSGGRSMQVARFLERNGYTEVANLSGGILAWHEQVDSRIAVY